MIFESVIHMDKIKEGDKLQIHCYKHNGRLERVSDEAIVLEINEDWIVCGNYKTKITEDDGRSYKTKEPAILFFRLHNKYPEKILPHETFRIYPSGIAESSIFHNT